MKLRSVRQTSLNTGDGGTTQDYTVSGFGTATAAIVTITFADTNDTIEGGAALGIGLWASDGTSWWVGVRAEDNGTSGIINTASLTTDDFRLLDPSSGSTYLTGTIAAVTDGIRLTYSTKPVASVLIRVDLIQCDDATCDTQNTASASPSASYNSASFQPNAIITLHGVSTAAGWRPCIGFGAEDTGSTITQGSIAAHSGSNNAPVNIAQGADTSHFTSRSVAPGFSLSNFTLDSFDASGFTFSEDSGSSDHTFGFLLIRDAGTDFWAGVGLTATSTGTENYTSPGFSAEGGWIAPTFLDTSDAMDSGGDNGTIGLHTFNSNEQHSACVSLEDGSSNSVAKSYVDTDGFNVLQDDGTLAIEGTISSHGSGFSITTTSTDASARRFLALVFSGEDVFDSTDETLELSESVDSFTEEWQDQGETLEVSEEVVNALVTVTVQQDAGMGQGALAGVQAGQLGFARVEAGQGV